MEKGTVTIPIERFKELKKYKETLTNHKCLVYQTHYCRVGGEIVSLKIMSNNDVNLLVNKSIEEDSEYYKNQNRRLNLKINELRNELSELGERLNASKKKWYHKLF